MQPIIYADNAATTKLRAEAIEAMKPYLIEEYGNPSQPYSFSRSAKRALKWARDIIANCINALPEEIYFTSGGTESDNWAIKGVAFALNDRREIITSAIEHHAILRSCEFIEKLGYSVAYLPVSKEGGILPLVLSDAITNRTGLVSIMFANNEIGTIQPIIELAAIAHKNGAVFHTDAVQAVGHVGMDVKKLGVDMLSASAHKFGGPKGIGFLYVKKGTNLASYMSGGSQEFSKRAGTQNVSAVVGMAVALQSSMNDIIALRRLYEEESFFISKLQDAGLVIDNDFTWNGNHEIGKHLPGIINLSFKGKDGESIMHRLDLKGIMISTGAACDSVNTQVSHVIKAINVPNDFAKGTVRISFNQETCHADVETIVNALLSILK